MTAFTDCAMTCSEVAELLKAMAHPQRLRILARLGQGARHVGGLAQDLEMRQSAVSQHLRILRMSGFVSAARNGGQMQYSLALPELKQVLRLSADINEVIGRGRGSVAAEA